MPNFEDRIRLERERKAAEEHQRKLEEKREQEVKETALKLAAEKERLRVRAVENSSEWKQMMEFSQSPDFMLALKMLWESSAEKTVYDGVVEHKKNIRKASYIGKTFFGENDHFEIEKEYIKKTLTFEEALQDMVFLPEFTDCGSWAEIVHGKIEIRLYGRVLVTIDDSGYIENIKDFWNIDIVFNSENVDRDIVSTNIVVRSYGIGPGLSENENVTTHYKTPSGIIIIFEGSIFSPEDFFDYIAQQIVDAESKNASK